MKTKVILPIIIMLLVVLVPLSGCQSGVSQNVYDSAIAQLNDAQNTISQLQEEMDDLEDAREAVDQNLEAAWATIDDLQVQISGMAGQYDLTGDTILETVTNIIEFYHDTHAYSKPDLFVCSDMASEVWSMLKARGINARIVVGNIDVPIDDIVQSDHAWLLAEVDGGEYVALETTGGYVVYEDENPLYYRGWYFNNPADMKSYNALIKEYNVRVEIVNDLIARDNQVVDQHNQSTNPSERANLEAVHEMLEEIIMFHETELYAIADIISDLAARCST